MKKTVSIVTPFYNEEESIGIYFTKLEEILGGIDGVDHEFIAVEDGSVDDTFKVLQSFAVTRKNLKIVKLSRNFGKDIALTAGLDFAEGDAVIPLDADLQDSPEIIPQMIEKWQSGYKIVLAKRVSRQDPFLKKITAKIFYYLASKIMDCNLPINVGDFRLIDKVVLSSIRKMREKARFMRGILSWVGYEAAIVEYERCARTEGKTKYNYASMIKYACDGIFSFSTFPIRLISYFGALLSFCSFCYGIYIIIQKFFSNDLVLGYASIMCVILFVSGINFVFIGIIGEYVGRIFNEVKNRPLYVVEKEVNIANKSNYGV